VRQRLQLLNIVNSFDARKTSLENSASDTVDFTEQIRFVTTTRKPEFDSADAGKQSGTSKWRPD